MCSESSKKEEEKGKFLYMVVLQCFSYTNRQRIRYKLTDQCKLRNYRLGPLDADPMDGVRDGIFFTLKPPTR